MTKERLAELRVLCDTTGLIPANIVREFIAHYDGFIGPAQEMIIKIHNDGKEKSKSWPAFSTAEASQYIGLAEATLRKGRKAQHYKAENEELRGLLAEAFSYLRNVDALFVQSLCEKIEEKLNAK